MNEHQRSLFTPTNYGDTVPAVHGSATSEAAARSITPRLNQLQQCVLALIRAAPDGLTDENGIDASGLSPSTYRPRRIELTARGLVRDSGKTRKTRSGRAAVVWEATK